MITFPNAKINLGLNILSKRGDGYHEISSCLYPIPWHDVLEIVPSQKFQFQQTGLTVEGADHDNLCVKAYDLLKETHDLPPVAIHLHKVIPMGAGLGGGSSDATFTITMLNKMFVLEMTDEEMIEVSAKLGSDCPFFIHNAPTMVSGTGTTLERISLDLSAFFIGLISPKVHVSTAEAYGSIVPSVPTKDIVSILFNPVSQWQGVLKNDFETPIKDKHLDIKKALAKIDSQNPLYSAMSGSGSAVFGIFENDKVDQSAFDIFEPLTISL